MKLLNYTFSKPAFWQQILAGVLFGLGNELVLTVASALHFRILYLDMIFTFAGSFFGFLPGVIAGLVFNVINGLWEHNLVNQVFFLCQLLGVALTRLLVAKHKNWTFPKLLVLVLLSAVLIALLGGYISAVLFDEIFQTNIQSVIFLVWNLMKDSKSLVNTMILANLPISLFDKFIAVFFGFYIAKLADIFFKKHSQQNNGS